MFFLGIFIYVNAAVFQYIVKKIDVEETIRKGDYDERLFDKTFCLSATDNDSDFIVWENCDGE